MEQKLKGMYKTAGRHLAERIIGVFEGEEINAVEWFYNSIKTFGGESPEIYCKKKKFFEIEEELKRIEHRVF